MIPWLAVILCTLRSAVRPVLPTRFQFFLVVVLAFLSLNLTAYRLLWKYLNVVGSIDPTLLLMAALETGLACASKMRNLH
jgi:hypothetical protein